MKAPRTQQVSPRLNETDRSPDRADEPFRPVPTGVGEHASLTASRGRIHLLTAKVVLPPAPRVLAPALWIVNWFLRAGTIATMPRWMRKLSGYTQPRIVDLLVRPVLRLGYGVVDRNPRLKLAVARLLAPSAVPVVAPYVLGVPPLSEEVLTPAEARRRYGYDRPADAHRDIRAKQHQRVFGAGQAPSEDGLLESQAVLGSLS